jgi:hypothetical protein
MKNIRKTYDAFTEGLIALEKSTANERKYHPKKKRLTKKERKRMVNIADYCVYCGCNGECDLGLLAEDLLNAADTADKKNFAVANLIGRLAREGVNKSLYA